MTNNERNDLVKLVTTLYDDFVGDSKFKSAAAEQSAIELCEPIIKKYYNFCKEMNVFVYDIFGNIYDADRGGIDKILKFTGEYILFHYTDGRTGKEFETEIKFPIGWLHPQHFEMVFCYEIRKRRIAKLKRDIECAKKTIEQQKTFISNADEEIVALQELVGGEIITADYEKGYMPNFR